MSQLGDKERVFLPRFSRMKSPVVATWPGFSHASLNSICLHSSSTCSVRLALCIVTLLLCAGIEPNSDPTTTRHDDLGSKIDALADEMRMMNKATVDRLDILCRDITARLALCETVATELKSDVAQLKTSINDNALHTAKLTSDLAQLKSDLFLSASAASTVAVILPPSSSLSAHTNITPTIRDIAMELNLRERKKLNVIVFGLPPGPDDKQAFED